MATINTNKIEMELDRLAYQIEDAQRRLQRTAETMLRKSQDAVQDAQHMIDGKPCSISWMNFMDGILKEAHEAKVELLKLIERQKIVQSFITE